MQIFICGLLIYLFSLRNIINSSQIINKVIWWKSSLDYAFFVLITFLFPPSHLLNRSHTARISVNGNQRLVSYPIMRILHMIQVSEWMNLCIATNISIEQIVTPISMSIHTAARRNSSTCIWLRSTIKLRYYLKTHLAPEYFQLRLPR